jgi:hypothetical protein
MASKEKIHSEIMPEILYLKKREDVKFLGDGQ